MGKAGKKKGNNILMRLKPVGCAILVLLGHFQPTKPLIIFVALKKNVRLGKRACARLNQINSLTHVLPSRSLKVGVYLLHRALTLIL